MKKKLFALLMAMVLVLGMSTTALAEVGPEWLENEFYNSPFFDNTPEFGDFVWRGTAYEFNDEEKNSCSVVGLCKENVWTSITIPAEVTGFAVTGIVDAFEGNANIVTVSIPSSVKFIDAYSFNGCTNLAEIIYAGTTYTDVVAFMNAYVANGGSFGSDDPVAFEFGGTKLAGAKAPSLIDKLEVNWSTEKPWYVETVDMVTTNGDYDYQCFADVLKDGEYVGNTGLWEEAANNKVEFDLSYIVALHGSGKYTVEVSVVDMSTRMPVATGTSAVAVYDKPEQQLATPTNAKIDLEKDVLVFDQVKDASVYYIWIWEEYAEQKGDYIYSWIVDENTSDGKVEIDLSIFSWNMIEDKPVGFAEYIKDLKENSAYADIKITFGVQAISENINKVAASDCVKVVGYENKVTKEQAKENFEDAFADLENNNPGPALEALRGVSNETITELLETDAEFTKKVVELDEYMIEEMGDDYKGAVSQTELVDADKVKVVGVAINGIGCEDVKIIFAEPEENATVPEGYDKEKAIQLDISLMADGYAMEDLSVPVTITIPVPTGVAKENLVILHYHGDAKEPAVIVPTVNADGTMTFIVSGFSTFVVTNEVVEAAPETPANPEAPKTGDVSTTTTVCSLLLLAVGVVLISKRKSFVK